MNYRNSTPRQSPLPPVGCNAGISIASFHRNTPPRSVETKSPFAVYARRCFVCWRDFVVVYTTADRIIYIYVLRILIAEISTGNTITYQCGRFYICEVFHLYGALLYMEGIREKNRVASVVRD